MDHDDDEIKEPTELDEMEDDDHLDDHDAVEPKPDDEEAAPP